MLNPLRTVDDRRQALAGADTNQRIEGLARNPQTVHIFAAWVAGTATENDAIAALNAHYKQDAQQEHIGADADHMFA